MVQDRDSDGNEKISYESLRDIYRLYEVNHFNRFFSPIRVTEENL